MRLESNLQIRGILPMLTGTVTVVLLLLFFLLLSTSFLLQPGVAVELAPSRFLLPAAQDPLVVAITGDPGASVYFEDRAVEISQLATRLESRRTASRQVVIKADGRAPHALVAEVTELALEKGFSVAIAATQPPPRP